MLLQKYQASHAAWIALTAWGFMMHTCHTCDAGPVIKNECMIMHTCDAVNPCDAGPVNMHRYDHEGSKTTAEPLSSSSGGGVGLSMKSGHRSCLSSIKAEQLGTGDRPDTITVSASRFPTHRSQNSSVWVTCREPYAAFAVGWPTLVARIIQNSGTGRGGDRDGRERLFLNLRLDSPAHARLMRFGTRVAVSFPGLSVNHDLPGSLVPISSSKKGVFRT